MRSVTPRIIRYSAWLRVRRFTERTIASRFLRDLPADQIDYKTIETAHDRSVAHLGRSNAAEGDGQDSLYYPGRRVVHEEYGEGQVLYLEPRGRSTYIRILFSEFGERSFALEHVPLYIVED